MLTNFELFLRGDTYMDGRGVIISWSATNWVTIFLMAAVGSFIVGLGWRLVSGRMGQSQAAQ